MEQRSTHSEAEPLLSYSRVGVIAGDDGHAWLHRRTICPYCRSPLTDLGSFHRNCASIAEEVLGSNAALGFCLDCGNRAALIDRVRAPKDWDGWPMYYPAQLTPLMGCLPHVLSCTHCGWWCSGEQGDTCNTPVVYVNVAILESFDIADAATPVSVLESEFTKWVGRIGDLHPNRLEDLVARMLAGVHDCEVKQLGYTRDGGIDLIVLLSDRPIAVQVKRRSVRRAELVSPIREFLGAAILQGYKDLLFVTTAPRYSRGSSEAAKMAEERGVVSRFDLISLPELKAMMPTATKPIWQNALTDVAKKRRSFVKVRDPYRYARRNAASPLPA